MCRHLLTLATLALFFALPLATAAQKPRRSAPPPKKTDAIEFDYESVSDDEPISDWLVVSVNKGRVISINSRKISRQPNGVVRAWFKNRALDKNDPSLEKIGDKTVTENLMLIEYQCGEERGRTLSLTKYDADGDVLDVIEPERPSWSYVNPDSIGERQMGKACAMVNTAKK
jgi:hypothetical protein